MPKYSAQGSLTVKRLRNGDTLYLTLELGDNPLFQAVDPQTGEVTPDWTQAANQPVITPVASSTRSATVSLSNHVWSYNGALLVFSGAVSGDWRADSTGRFQLNTTTGALKIVANLASLDNPANDTLTYSVTATVAGIEYTLTKSIDIQIQESGASTYNGFIQATTTQLKDEVGKTSATLTPKLWLRTPVTSFYVKWYKGANYWTATTVTAQNPGSVTVDRSDIDSTQIIRAEFFLSVDDASGDPVATYGITIIDTLDEITVVPYITSSAKEVDTGTPVTVAARIVKTKDGSVLTPVNPTWSFDVYNGDTWNLIRTVTTASVQITVADTDNQDGTYHNVVVLAGFEAESFS